MIDWYLKVVRDNYANFSGRARRSEYWYYALCNVLISIVLGIADYLIGLEINVLRSIYSLAVFIPGLAVLVRRMHDIGKSGWFVLTFLIPVFVGAGWLGVISTTTLSGDAPDPTMSILPALLLIGAIVWMIVLLCKNGQEGPNEYGPDPKNPYDGIDEIGADETEN